MPSFLSFGSWERAAPSALCILSYRKGCQQCYVVDLLFLNLMYKFGDTIGAFGYGFVQMW